MAARSAAARSKAAALDARTAVAAFERLERHKAMNTLLRAGLPAATLRRLLKDAIPPSRAEELPEEVWAALALGIALESADFALLLAQELQDHLAWDQEPGSLDEWWTLVVERPLEALWMAALSTSKTVRQELGHIVFHCLENYRSSPDCRPPSWEFVDGLYDVYARQERSLREWQRRCEDAESRLRSEHERLEELRQELRRVRRESAGERAQRAQAERRVDDLRRQVDAASTDAATVRSETLERRARKAEKEREHLLQELARRQGNETPTEVEVEASEPEPDAADAPPPGTTPDDDTPRGRIVRQVLRKLIKKGKIGAAHTHEDNLYRGIADHEKGLAKQAMDLFYREGLLVPKPTVNDPHVSLSPERLPEIQALIAGHVLNPRIRRFIEESDLP